jgi:ribose 5-phosphate isomerase A
MLRIVRNRLRRTKSLRLHRNPARVVLMSSAAKQNAAARALEREVTDGMILGVGTGSTTAYFIQALARRVQKEQLNITCVPSSIYTQNLCIKAGLRLTTLDEEPRLDITVDGADEIDSTLNLIKGGGGALTREKIVASASKRLAIIADETKLVKKLGEKHPIPIEVLPFALGFVKTQLKRMRPREMKLRMNHQGKDAPVITDNGNLILDMSLGTIKEPKQTSAKLDAIPGVIENGIFAGMTDIVYLGAAKSVRILQ